LSGWVLARDAIGNRAAEATRVADVTVEGYLRDRQAELTLLQTALIGGLLMVLSAIQALHYTVPLPSPLHAPLIALLGSLALALLSSSRIGGFSAWVGPAAAGCCLSVR
jgi:hypothetical protein